MSAVGDHFTFQLNCRPLNTIHKQPTIAWRNKRNVALRGTNKHGATVAKLKQFDNSHFKISVIGHIIVLTSSGEQ
jgi:hypothetical protein